jgi:hypothetical protein
MLLKLAGVISPSMGAKILNNNPLDIYIYIYVLTNIMLISLTLLLPRSYLSCKDMNHLQEKGTIAVGYEVMCSYIS